MQLGSIIDENEGFLKQARKKLKRKDEDLEMLESLRGQQGRLLCPFCLYTSSKNKTSAQVKNGCFKCFACGRVRRVPE